MIVLGAIALPTYAIAQDSGVRIENISRPQVKAEPGQIVSTTFRIWNETKETREFQASAELPDGWNLISPLFPFTLKETEEKFLFVAVALPKYELAGSYKASIEVVDTSFAGVRDAEEISITVIPVAKVEVHPPVGEYRILAGEEYTRTFTVVNQSNAPSRFEIDVTSHPRSWETAVEPSEFSLIAGSTQAVVATVQTPSGIKREVRHRITLKARSLDLNRGTVEAEAGVTTIVFPRLLAGDMYETLDGDYSFLLSWEEDETVAAQFELDLKGELGEGRWGEVYFAGPYPSRWRGQWLLKEDRFHIEYGDEKKGYVSVGDDTLEITPLTERYFYGRGIDLEVRKGPLAFRAFASKRHAGWQPERLMGAQVSVEAPGNTEVTLTALRKEETHVPDFLNRGRHKGSAVSISATSMPAEGVELEGEYGRGRFDDGEGGGSKSDSAYRVAAKINRDWFSFDGELVRAGAHFPGYWQDTKRSNAHLSVNLGRGISLWGSYGESEFNLEGDPLRARPEYSYRNLGVSFPAGPLGRASIYRRWTPRHDHSLFQWNERDRTTNLQLSHSFGKLSLSGTAEFGKRQNRLTGTDRDLERYRVIFSARPGRDTTFSGGYSWDVEDTALGGARQKSNQLWLNADVRLGKRTELSASYSRTSGSGRPSYNWLRADLKHELSRGRSVRIRIQRRGGALGKELAVGLELVFPLSVPVPWLAKSGSLEGRVYENGNRAEPLAGVVVLVDGMKVATDDKGRFSFPSLPAGEYELRIDRSTIGLARIPDTATPLVFAIKAGETVNLDIPIVPGATVSGNVAALLWTNGNGNGHGNGNDSASRARNKEPASLSSNDRHGESEGSIPLKALGVFNGSGNGNGSAYHSENGNHDSYGNGDGYRTVNVSGVAVVLENGEQQLIRVTDLDGQFGFSELRPGHWRLVLANGQVPKHYELTPFEFVFELLPGQTMDALEFVLSPVARPVKITTENDGVILHH